VFLIDAGYAMSRSLYINPEGGPLTHNGFFTGGAYIFLKIHRELIMSGAEVVFCVDGGRPKYRTDILPEYKGDRDSKKSEEELEQHRVKKTHTAAILKDTIGALGLPWFRIGDWEADDILFRLAQSYRDRGYEVTAVSDDSDYYQLVNHGVAVHQVMKDNLVVESNFREKAKIGKEVMDFDPARFTTVLAMTGSHNNVPGIKGVGIKTAMKIVNEIEDNSVDAIMDWAESHREKPPTS
jgi:DNA polymerase-1